MRKEQDAIDTRLFNRYMQWAGVLVDHDLIKQCDHDACDIEAVELGVPNFSDIEMRFTKDYRNRKAIHADSDDIELFRRINNRSFGVDTIKGRESFGVLLFASALRRAEERDYKGFLEEVNTWGLL